MATHVSKWKIVTLGDVAKEITVGFVGTMAEYYTERGVRFLRSQDIFPYGIDTTDNKFISPEFNNKLRKSELHPGDVVIVRTGKPGTCAVIPKGFGIANCSDLVIVRPGPDLDSRYLCYYVNAMAQNYVGSYLVGAVQQHFNVSAARGLPIPLPNVTEQRRIAAILSTLDDKIELNRRMNETLEAMARALFRSWFVDFDPVRIKASGGDPVAELGLAPEIAALFPDSFEDSELGEIPTGWVASSVGREFNLIMGQSPPGETYNKIGEGLPFFQGKTDFGFRFPKNRMYCSAPTRLAKPNDTLVSVRAPVGSTNIALEKCAIGRGVAAIRHISGSASFTYYAMVELSSVFEKFDGEGTVFGSINKDAFNSIPLFASPKDVVAAFENAVCAMDARIRTNEMELSSLAETRDYLLPKLLSGEIPVEEGEDP